MNTGETKRKRTFRTFTYRGIPEGDLTQLSHEELAKILPSNARRRITRGLSASEIEMHAAVKKSLAEKIEGEKPETVLTRERCALILPEMFGGVVGVYNGKGYIQVEIKPEMIGTTLGEYSLTYKQVTHGKPGVGATSSSKFVPLK
ncbi:MAG: 40S ribosomal protein S15 [Amphiamblys sp. WSBS2006]|nr:MAG: 40S ribosomal protein S15 [Amphiamblys sp. WSBS2006]